MNAPVNITRVQASKLKPGSDVRLKGFTLSAAQVRFMKECAAAHPNGYQSPATGDAASVRRVSAWHRTCDSLVRAGLVAKSNNGSMYWARLTHAAQLLSACVAVSR